MSDAIEEPRYRVFLSHTGDDEALARYLAMRIEGVGVRAFIYRRDARIGDDPDEMIEHEIEASDELLILLTPRSLDRCTSAMSTVLRALEKSGSARHAFI